MRDDDIKVIYRYTLEPWERYTAVDPMVVAVPLNLISSNSTGTELLSLHIQISEKKTTFQIRHKDKTLNFILSMVILYLIFRIKVITIQCFSSWMIYTTFSLSAQSSLYRHLHWYLCIGIPFRFRDIKLNNISWSGNKNKKNKHSSFHYIRSQVDLLEGVQGDDRTRPGSVCESQPEGDRELGGTQGEQSRLWFQFISWATGNVWFNDHVKGVSYI